MCSAAALKRAPAMRSSICLRRWRCCAQTASWTIFPALARRSPRRSANCSTPASSVLREAARQGAGRCAGDAACAECRPAQAGELYSEFGIASLADLKAAAESGKLDKVKGFGPNGRRNHTGHQRRRKPRQAHLMIDALRAAEV